MFYLKSRSCHGTIHITCPIIFTQYVLSLSLSLWPSQGNQHSNWELISGKICRKTNQFGGYSKRNANTIFQTRSLPKQQSIDLVNFQRWNPLTLTHDIHIFDSKLPVFFLLFSPPLSSLGFNQLQRHLRPAPVVIINGINGWYYTIKKG